MAELVWEAIYTGQHAVIEAGTGIGKTLAYLVPLVEQHKKAIVSTANKTLQTQLIEKDLPLLRRALPQPFTFALLKGRSNYICNLRLSELLLKPTVKTDISALQKLNIALVSRPDGDLDSLPVNDKLKPDLVVAHEDCLGESCRFYSECYYHCARMEAEIADIVVVNHALLARTVLGQGIPLRDIVVVDEAHELAGYMIGALKKLVTFARVTRVLHGGYVQELVPQDLLQPAEAHAERLFDELRRDVEQSEETSLALTRPDLIEMGRVLVGEMQHIAQVMEGSNPVFHNDESATEAHFELAVRRANNLASDMAAVFSSESKTHARYVELIGDDQQSATTALNLAAGGR